MNTEEIKELKKIWALKTEEDTELKPEEQKAFLDDGQIMAVIPKTARTRDTIKTIFEVEDRAVPVLEYSETSKYSIGYLKQILKFLSVCDDESVKISVKKDYPITFETTKFRIILAPRVEN